MPEVSVVVPSYNYDKYIGETIGGILGQTFSDLELIIVDDCSKDRSREVIADYARRDDRIKVLLHEENRGIARTFNDGIDAACGKYVAITGCDDVWFEHKLQRQLEVLNSNEDLVVYSDTVVIDGEGKVTGDSRSGKSRTSKRKRSGWIFRDLLEGNFVSGSSMIFKRDNVKDIRFDEQYRYVNDYKFVLDLARKCEYYHVSEPLVKYRVHGANITLRDNGGWLSDFAMFGRHLLDNYGSDFTRKARARFLFKIADDALFRGDCAEGRRYILKAMASRPFRVRYWQSFFSSFNASRSG
jgi:glycosyltransferase involved in cell wall biosynthesis